MHECGQGSAGNTIYRKERTYSAVLCGILGYNRGIFSYLGKLMPIPNEPLVLEPDAQLLAATRLLGRGPRASQFDLFFNGAHRFLRNIHEFNANSKTRHTIANFAARTDLDAGES